MKKFATGSLLLALSLGLVSCDKGMGGSDKKKEPYHPRRGMLTQQAEQQVSVDQQTDQQSQ